jgi:NADH dehydrogenase/NADH:ubiquinone oxidoreductase subunit G
MAVKMVQKQQPKVKGKAKKADVLQATATLTAEERAKAEAFAEAVGKLEPFRDTIKEADALKKFLASVASDLTRFTAKEPAKLEGDTVVVEFSPCGNSREIIDMHGLLTALKAKAGGYEGLLSILSVTLKDVDRYLSAAEQAPYVKEVPGSRRFVAVHAKE